MQQRRLLLLALFFRLRGSKDINVFLLALPVFGHDFHWRRLLLLLTVLATPRVFIHVKLSLLLLIRPIGLHISRETGHSELGGANKKRWHAAAAQHAEGAGSCTPVLIHTLTPTYTNTLARQLLLPDRPIDSKWPAPTSSTSNPGAKALQFSVNTCVGDDSGYPCF